MIGRSVARSESLGLLWLGPLTLAIAAATVVGCSPSGPSRLTVVNRTTQDVVILFGYEFSLELYVPACGEAVHVSPGGDEEPPSPPPDAVRIQYQFSTLADAPTISTTTITSEGIRGPLPSLPPCEGLAPTPTPTASPSPAASPRASG